MPGTSGRQAVLVSDGATDDQLLTALEGFWNELNECTSTDEPMVQLNMDL